MEGLNSSRLRKSPGRPSRWAAVPRAALGCPARGPFAPGGCQRCCSPGGSSEGRRVSRSVVERESESEGHHAEAVRVLRRIFAGIGGGCGSSCAVHASDGAESRGPWWTHRPPGSLNQRPPERRLLAAFARTAPGVPRKILRPWTPIVWAGGQKSAFRRRPGLCSAGGLMQSSANQSLVCKGYRAISG